MTLAEMMNKINALGREIRAAADRLMADAADNTHDMQDIERQQSALRDMNDRMAALRLAYTTQEDAERGNLGAPQGCGNPAQERSLHDMLASREYANAFAHAIRTGAKPGRDLFADKHKVLYDALTIAGGDPAGEDGGFLVPEDIDRSMVFISSTQAKPGCMEAIKAGLRQYGNFENVYETDIGTTIGGYSGPGTIGIVFARKQ